MVEDINLWVSKIVIVFKSMGPNEVGWRGSKDKEEKRSEKWNWEVSDVWSLERWKWLSGRLCEFMNSGGNNRVIWQGKTYSRSQTDGNWNFLIVSVKMKATSDFNKNLIWRSEGKRVGMTCCGLSQIANYRSNGDRECINFPVTVKRCIEMVP